MMEESFSDSKIIKRSLMAQFVLVKEDLEKEDTCGMWAMTSV